MACDEIVSVTAHGIKHGDSCRPCLIATRNTGIVPYTLKGSSQYMTYTLRTKRRQYTFCVSMETHSIKALPNCRLNSIPAGNIRFQGGPKSVQFPVFLGVFAGLLAMIRCARRTLCASSSKLNFASGVKGFSTKL